MCGIIAILRRPSDHPAPELGELRAELEACADLLAGEPRDPALPARLHGAADRLCGVDRALKDAAGLRAVVLDEPAEQELRAAVARLRDRVGELEGALERDPVEGGALESLNAGLVALRDVLFSLERDRLDGARAVRALARGLEAPAAIAALYSVHQALQALDRLEVRGRDSAGLAVVLRDHGLDPHDREVARLLDERSDPLLRHGSARLLPGADAQAGAQPDAQPGAQPDAQAGAQPDAQAGAQPDAQAGAQPDAQAGAQPDAQAGAQPDAQAGAQPDAQAGAQPDAQADAQPTRRTARSPARCCWSTSGRPRSASSARTSASCALRSPPTSCSGARWQGPSGRRRRCSATPAGRASE
jgi:glutamine---fructose-6-phosphate transaminase (isomerizing)